MSDNERQLRGTKFSNPLESDGDIFGGSRKKGGMDNGMFNSVNGGIGGHNNNNNGGSRMSD